MIPPMGQHTISPFLNSSFLAKLSIDDLPGSTLKSFRIVSMMRLTSFLFFLDSLPLPIAARADVAFRTSDSALWRAAFISVRVEAAASC